MTSTGPATTRALLTRISTDEINQPYSLEAQDTRLEQFVASQPGMTITHRFTDQASGATLERPGLQRALELARAGTFDVLLVYRIDRLSRSIVGLMAVVEQLEQAGVALKSATEPIDTQGPVGRMLLQLLGIFAEFERGMLIDRITAGFERKAARGEWLGGRGPCGYDLDKDTKTLAVNATEAPIVQAIFDKYVTERLGATAIANWLNDTGRRTKYGSLWSGQTVLRMLRNPVYIGKISHDDATHDGKHDAILDPAVFEQAQQILDERAGDRPQLMSKSDYLLSGLTRCTSCHGAYVGISANGRLGRYRYYACRSRQAKGKRACPAERVRADGLETAVIDAVLDTYANFDLFEHTIAEAVAEIDSTSPTWPTSWPASKPRSATPPPRSTATCAPSKPATCPTRSADPA
jgi:site-specific DNA recombinase